VAAGERRRRRAPAAAAGQTEPASGCYQGVIEVAGAAGTVTSVPVCLEVGDYTGLWVGQVDLRYVRLLRRGAAPRDASGRGVIDPATGKYQVGSFTIPQDFPDAARDAAPELSFPLVIHVGPASQLKLLHQVAVMWKNGVPDNPQTVPSELVPGRYVIVTGDGLRAGLVESLGLVGGTLRDGRQFSFRKTAPTFPDNYDLTPEAGAGEFEGTGRFSTAIELSALHPLNPFLHRYHPDHGHPKVMRSTGNVPARGGLDVKRSVWLTFDRDTDPRTQGEVVVEGVTYQDQAQPGYGDQVIGGTYREVIESITYDPVIVEGSFRLYRSVRSVKVLNDGAPVE
jgi:hypothetical protein